MEHVTSRVSGGESRTKNVTCFHIIFLHFFVVFHYKICVFITFISFLDSVSNFQNIINQSEMGISDKKLAVELYAKQKFVWIIVNKKDDKAGLLGCGESMTELQFRFEKNSILNIPPINYTKPKGP